MIQHNYIHIEIKSRRYPVCVYFNVINFMWYELFSFISVIWSNFPWHGLLSYYWKKIPWTKTELNLNFFPVKKIPNEIQIETWKSSTYRIIVGFPFAFTGVFLLNSLWSAHWLKLSIKLHWILEPSILRRVLWKIYGFVRGYLFTIKSHTMKVIDLGIIIHMLPRDYISDLA